MKLIEYLKKMDIYFPIKYIDSDENYHKGYNICYDEWANIEIPDDRCKIGVEKVCITPNMNNLVELDENELRHILSFMVVNTPSDDLGKMAYVDGTAKRIMRKFGRNKDLVELDKKELEKWIETDTWSDMTSKEISEYICSKFGSKPVPSMEDIEKVILSCMFEGNNDSYKVIYHQKCAQTIHSLINGEK